MAESLNRMVTEGQIRTFHEWLTLLADGFDEAVGPPGPYAKSYGPEGAARYYTDHHLFHRFGRFRRFLFEGPIARVAAEILGADGLGLYDEHLPTKESWSLPRST